jgi:hypothetical protein
MNIDIENYNIFYIPRYHYLILIKQIQLYKNFAEASIDIQRLKHTTVARQLHNPLCDRIKTNNSENDAQIIFAWIGCFRLVISDAGKPWIRDLHLHNVYDPRYAADLIVLPTRR